MFLFAASGDLCSLSSSCKVLSENHWASFFHQASLGSHLNYQFSTNHSQTHKGQHLVNAEVCPYNHLIPFMRALVRNYLDNTTWI